ncbi:phytanoyl-CoA dioxygenase family protein [Embleya sp. NBC_00888]|uniref:phytanoyl-CoA dioxygenase family protein n=1 Tax=Embleya sp. NBC_00888 TaxID=2975960 RepID=UPI003863A2F2|nr:phytanoyl-CoA dioxygenase family protein [Embleya sp. NBC_00888]
MTPTPLPTCDPTVVESFSRDGFAVLRNILAKDRRDMLRHAADRLLASAITTGRDRGTDGKDGFRGVVALDSAFLPLVAEPTVLTVVATLLGPNLHLLSSHLIALPSIPPDGPRTIRTPERPGWHRDMYGVSRDLGSASIPRLAIKAAYFLTDPTPTAGVTMFVPGSHLRTDEVQVPAGSINPPDAVVPPIGPYDVVLFENRTWHAGGLNTSGSPRLAVMMQYGYRWLAPVDDPAAELLRRADLTDVERQLLGAADRDPDGSLAKGAGARPLTRWLEHREQVAVVAQEANPTQAQRKAPA